MSPEVKTKVIKRNGKEVSFDISKITHAIEKANEEVDNLHQINIFQISAIADKIAKSVNLDAEDPLRVREGLLYILSEASHDEGHMCLRQDVLVVRTYFLLNGASRNTYNDYVKSIKKSGQIIPLKDYLESTNI